MVSIIAVENLTKEFVTKQKGEGFRGSLRTLWKPEYRKLKAVDGISFEVSEGELLAFIGPNGAGKSTTIKMLTGILYPTSGSARVLGFTPWHDRVKLSFQISSVFGQKSQLWYHLPPRDSFNLLSKIYEIPESQYKTRVDYLVDVCDIEDLLSTPVRKLSLGQRMRCEITAALIHKPKVIFLDEPTIGLDVIARFSIRDLIKRLNQEEKVTVFLTSHDAGVIEGLCKRVIVIDRGIIALDNSLNSLRRNYLKLRVIDLKLESEIDGFEQDGVEVLENSPHGLKLQVNTEVSSVERVISYILGRYRVLDISISDPPMEEIVAMIYKGNDVLDELA